MVLYRRPINGGRQTSLSVPLVLIHSGKARFNRTLQVTEQSIFLFATFNGNLYLIQTTESICIAIFFSGFWKTEITHTVFYTAIPIFPPYSMDPCRLSETRGMLRLSSCGVDHHGNTSLDLGSYNCSKSNKRSICDRI